MFITENRLRRIIRDIIVESLESEQLNEGWKEKVTTGLTGLMMYFGSMGIGQAKPISHSKADSYAESILSKEVGMFDLRIQSMIEEVLISVDEEHIDIVKREVINPWLNAVKKVKENPKKYRDPVTGNLEEFVYDVLGDLLSKKVDEFILSKTNKVDKSTSDSVNKTVKVTSSVQSVFSPEDLKRWKKAVKGKDFKTQGEIVAKYRGDS